jgi:DNA-binding GntR family transcriptional regulator
MNTEPVVTIERASLADQLFFHIKKMILTQQLKGGESIPEEKIAKTFGVSRTPIRETLRRLEKYGLVKLNPGYQATVVKISPQETKYIGEVRTVLETLAVRKLAKKAAREDIDHLTALADKCVQDTQNGDLGEAYERDGLFHLEIAKRCGNPYIYSILKTIDAKLHLIRIISCSNLKVMSEDIKIHYQIIHAIAGRDPGIAAQLIKKHIKNFIDNCSKQTLHEKQ